jgi:hypothetical protein
MTPLQEGTTPSKAKVSLEGKAVIRRLSREALLALRLPSCIWLQDCSEQLLQKRGKVGISLFSQGNAPCSIPWYGIQLQRRRHSRISQFREGAAVAVVLVEQFGNVGILLIFN